MPIGKKKRHVNLEMGAYIKGIKESSVSHKEVIEEARKRAKRNPDKLVVKKE